MPKSLLTTRERLEAQMTNIEKLSELANRFQTNLAYYKDAKNNYNEHSCRIEYIDPLLKILGWDVANEKGLAPQYREVIAENYSTPTDRPDYTMTLRGVAKFFVEAKNPNLASFYVTRLVLTPTLGGGCYFGLDWFYSFH